MLPGNYRNRVYNKIVRSDEYRNRLLGFIQREYGIGAVSLTPAKRGFYGETWRLDSDGAAYFLKLVYPAAHKPLYENSFAVISHLCDHGIDFICRIKKAKDESLYTRFDNAVLGVFNWIDGENIETDATKIPEFQMLAKVYTVPAQGVSIPREDYSGKSAETFFGQWDKLKNERLLALLEKDRAKLEHRAKRLANFAGLCRGDPARFFITHGDAGGNFLAGGGRYYIVDWDNPVLAPPERDGWCMCGREWARDAFQNALLQNGITHILRKEQLAYYCYDFFFFYLSSYLDSFAPGDSVQEIEKFMDGWIEESIRYADPVFYNHL